MVISFTLPDTAAAMLNRLVKCIAEVNGAAPEADEIVRSMVIDLLADDAVAHGEIAAPVMLQ
jgi:hypothetical protein